MADTEALISVTAVGEVSVVPDRLRLAIGVSVIRPQPGDALEALAVRVTLLQAVLDDLEVAREDRQTSELTLRREFDRRNDTPAHSASSGFDVIVDDFDTGAQILARAAEAVGDALTVSGLEWIITDPETALRTARHRAVTTATATAAELTAAAGAALGPLRSIREPPGDALPSGHRKFVAQAAAASAPLEPGRSVVAVAVEMAWALG